MSSLCTEPERACLLGCNGSSFVILAVNDCLLVHGRACHIAALPYAQESLAHLFSLWLVCQGFQATEPHEAIHLMPLPGRVAGGHVSAQRCLSQGKGLGYQESRVQES